jgi:IS30 family transposase
MGGDRTCPDDCILAVWTTLKPEARKAQRRPIAEQLYKQGFTMETIATQLGVHHSQIVRDLKDICAQRTNVKDRGADTLGRKKSTGRPKGSNRPSKRPQQEHIVAQADAGMTAKEIAAKVGITPRAVHRALQDERIKREAQPLIDPSTLSMTAREKLDIAIRQHEQKLKSENEKTVQEQVVKTINEMQLPWWEKRLTKIYDDIVYMRTLRKGVMSKTEYNKIWSCLHPDSRKATSDQKLQDAFGLFERLEMLLVSEKEAPTPFLDRFPRTHAEWAKRKEQVSEKRRAKRATAMANR